MSEMKDILGTGSTENKIKRLADYVGGEPGDPVVGHLNHLFRFIGMGGDFPPNLSFFYEAMRSEPERDFQRFGFFKKQGKLNRQGGGFKMPVSEYMSDNLDGLLKDFQQNGKVDQEIELARVRISMRVYLDTSNGSQDLTKKYIKSWFDRGYERDPNSSVRNLFNYLDRSVYSPEIYTPIMNGNGANIFQCQVDFEREVLCLPSYMFDGVVYDYRFSPVFWGDNLPAQSLYTGQMECKAEFLGFEKVQPVEG